MSLKFMMSTNIFALKKNQLTLLKLIPNRRHSIAFKMVQQENFNIFKSIYIRLKVYQRENQVNQLAKRNQ